jgi:hypothetical protein
VADNRRAVLLSSEPRRALACSARATADGVAQTSSPLARQARLLLPLVRSGCPLVAAAPGLTGAPAAGRRRAPARPLRSRESARRAAAADPRGRNCRPPPRAISPCVTTHTHTHA